MVVCDRERKRERESARASAKKKYREGESVKSFLRHQISHQDATKISHLDAIKFGLTQWNGATE